MKLRITTMLLLLFHLGSWCQENFPMNQTWGFRAGAVLALGTHFQRVGLCLNSYYVTGHFQMNAEWRGYFNFRTLGPPVPHGEMCLSLGAGGAFGGTAGYANTFVSTVSNQTGYLYSLNYAYNVYLNRVRTRQVTGQIHVGIGDFSLIAENDILAKPFLDRFRTGAVLLQYRYQNTVEVGINSTIWTGQYKSRQSINGVPAFYHNCYMDTARGTYTGYSHGMVSLQVKYQLPYYQYLQGNAGVDAEQVRDMLQNRLLHNMKFVPEEINKARNCHLPMIDSNGAPYLYRPDQAIRAPRLYLNLFTNHHVFY